MPDRTPALGTLRFLICPVCTERNKLAMRRQHEYRERREHRSPQHVERFWECSACGHKIPANGES
jgi:hypothetical protein